MVKHVPFPIGGYFGVLLLVVLLLVKRSRIFLLVAVESWEAGRMSCGGLLFCSDRDAETYEREGKLQPFGGKFLPICLPCC